mmetsp:Transcript_39848/g.63853  ORF Transcript_39848/g.63853 Transcript_39848/m.63853 type:complete len:155 (-) Transcript_39848:70-534(-)
MSDWVELNRDQWAKQYLDTLFKERSFALDGTEDAKMSFFRVETTGDCALARKGGGEPRPMFEFRIEIDWKVEQPVDRGKALLETKGQIIVSNFNSEDADEPQMKLTCDTKLPSGATPAFKVLMEKLHQAVKVAGMPKVKEMLSAEFVTALKQQV